MALDRLWIGRREKPRIDPFINRSRVHSKWGWVWDHQVAVWLFNEPGGDTLHDLLRRTNGTLSSGSSGSKPTWDRDGQLWGLTPIDAGTNAGIDLPSGTLSPLGDNFTPDQLTVEMWSVWMGDSGTDPRLFSKQTSSAGADHFIMTGATALSPRLRIKAGGTTETHVVNAPDDNPLVGDLVHHTWTYDGVTVRLYLNAVDTAIDQSTASSGRVDGGTGIPIRIGNAAQSGAANEWDAPIYKIAIYDAAMPPSMVVDICGDPYGPYREVEDVVGGVAVTVVVQPHMEFRVPVAA